MGRIEYRFCEDDGDFDVEAWLDGRRIGHARGMRRGDRLELLDIRIDDDARQPWPFLHRRLLSWIGPRRPLQLRGKGIGDALLSRILREADGAEIVEITGSVMRDAIDSQPFLLSWYERHGFVVTDPEAGCIRGAAKRIVRRLRP